MKVAKRYGKKSKGEIVALYVVVGLLVYGAVYYLYMGNKSNYNTKVNTLASVSPVATTSVNPVIGYKTGSNGMSLYVFDKDSNNVSNCYDQCAVNWPPYLVKLGSTMGPGMTSISRKDGTKQYALMGKPLYYYIKDVKVGDVLGDGVGGTWHLAR